MSKQSHSNPELDNVLGQETARHTPGPWLAVAATDPNFKTILQKPYQAPHVEMSSPEVRIAEHVRPDDARLIAAAPDLLEVLKQFMSAMTTEDFRAANFNAKRIIARATGEAA